jgi:GGDEF domain-containing protein/EAL domain-containing protein (putative c-di-GMP-specific phosphodiesterase class I)
VRVGQFLACALLLFAGPRVSGAQLGEINMRSSIGEPFAATISVSLTGNEDTERMVARVASQDAHAAFGVPYDDYLTAMRVEVAQGSNKGLLLRLFGTRPLREPYLEFIFELRFMTGSIYRAYTVVPEFELYQLTTDSREAPTTPQVSPIEATIRPVVAGQYTVREQDSVWRIAAGMDRRLGNVEKRIRLLRAANSLLVRGLRRGDQLVIPADDSLLTVVSPVAQQSGTVTSAVPSFADANSLAAIRRRAQGYQQVRLAAVGGPQISQAAGGETQVIADDSRTEALALEVDEIRANLEQLAAENTVLAADLKRLEELAQKRAAVPTGSGSGAIAAIPVAEERVPSTVPPSSSWYWLWLLLLIPVVMLVWISYQRKKKAVADRDDPLPDHDDNLGSAAADIAVVDNADQRNVDVAVSEDQENIADTVDSVPEAAAAFESEQKSTAPSEVDESPVVAKFGGDSKAISFAAVDRPGETSDRKTPASSVGSQADIAFESVNRDTPVEPDIPPVTPAYGSKGSDDIAFDAVPRESGDEDHAATASPVTPAFGNSTSDDVIAFVAVPPGSDMPVQDDAGPVTPAFGKRSDDIAFVPVDRQEDFPVSPPVTASSQDRSNQDRGGAIDFHPEAASSPETGGSAGIDDDELDPDELEKMLGADNAERARRLDAEAEFELETVEFIDEDELEDLDIELDPDAIDDVSASAPASASGSGSGSGSGTDSESEPTDDSTSDGPVDDSMLGEVFDHLTIRESPARVLPLPQNDAAAQQASVVAEAKESAAPVSSSAARWAELQQEWQQVLAQEEHNYAMYFVDIDDMDSIEDHHGPMKAEELVLQVEAQVHEAISPHGEATLHRIKDHMFLFVSAYRVEADMRARADALVRMIGGHRFLGDSDRIPMTLSVGIVPFTASFTSLDDYLFCGKQTVAELQRNGDHPGIGNGVAIHHETTDDDDEPLIVRQVADLLDNGMFEVHYQTLINLTGSQQQVYLCKTELKPEVDQDKLPEDFLRRAFTCRLTPAIERFTIGSFLDKILALGTDNVKMLFRVDIRSAMDSDFETWLFQEFESKGVDPTTVVLFIYANDVIAHRPHLIRFASALRRKGISMGLLNVDYEDDHLDVAREVGASIIRIAPDIVDEVVESSARFGARPVTSGTRESARLKDYLVKFNNASIETVLFTTYLEAIPGLVVINASNLRATYIQTPIGMIEDDPFDT